MGYLRAGLLKGAGRGIEKVGDNMWAEQKAKADDLRKQNLLAMQDKFATDRQKAGWGHDEQLLVDKNEREDLQKTNEIKNIEDLEDGTKQGFNVYGKKVGDSMTRPTTAAEAALAKKGGLLGGDIPNTPDTKLANQTIFRGVSARFFDRMKAENSNFNMTDFAITDNDGTTRYDTDGIYAKMNKKERAEVDEISRSAEKYQMNGYPPMHAAALGERDYMIADKARGEAAFLKQITKDAKDAGMPVKAYKDALKLAEKDGSLDMIAALEVKDPKRYEQLMDIYMTKKPLFYSAVLGMKSNNDPKVIADNMQGATFLPTMNRVGTGGE